MDFFILTKQQLQEEIQNGLKLQLEEFAKNFQPKEPTQYLTRQEVADMFNLTRQRAQQVEESAINKLEIRARRSR